MLNEHNVSGFGKVLIEIPPVIVHEMCHYCAMVDMNKFLKYTLNKYLVPFYTILFTLTDPNMEKIETKTIYNAGLNDITTWYGNPYTGEGSDYLDLNKILNAYPEDNIK